MKIGTVKGAIWATRKAPCLQGQIFLVVDTLSGVLVAAALVALYSAVVHYIEERGANKESGWED